MLPERLGSDSKGGAIVTAAGLVFVGGGDKYFYAFDKDSGREVWRGELPYANTATPMTYRTKSGEQFIVVATGSGSQNALVALSLATERGCPASHVWNAMLKWPDDTAIAR